MQIQENISLAPSYIDSKSWTSRINPEEIYNYWMLLFGKPSLPEGKTIRVTYTTPSKKGADIQILNPTANEPINSYEEFLKFIENKFNHSYSIADDQMYKHQKDIGFSISSGVFSVKPIMETSVNEFGESIISQKTETYYSDGKEIIVPQFAAPSTSTYNGTKTLVIDVDAYRDNGKERFNFNALTMESRRLAANYVLTILNQIVGKKIKRHYWLNPSATYSTGGGLQFVIEYDSFAYESEAKQIVKLLHYTFKHADLNDALGKKDVPVAPFATTPMHCFGFLGEGTEYCGFTKYQFKFDVSCLDVTHTQRVGGIVNPKAMYNGAICEPIPGVGNIDFFNTDSSTLSSLVSKLPDKDIKASAMIEDMNGFMKAFSDLYATWYNKFSKYIKDPELFSAKLPVKKFCNDSIIFFDYHQMKSDVLPTMYANQTDVDIISKIPIESQWIYMAKFMETDPDTMINDSSRISLLCPFHPEDHSSFTIYKNLDSKMAIAKDFHDGGTAYNIITFLMAPKPVLIAKEEATGEKIDGAHGMTRSAAIQKLAIEFGLSLTNSERKKFEAERSTEAVDDLIDQIDTKNYIYYRLANKNRACVIREFENGECYQFDGSHLMSDHILVNQLKQRQADSELKAIFHEKFVQRVLIDAFEEFHPGRDYTYERNFIQYVNTWIPGKEYKKVHELAKNVQDMDITSAIRVIKDRLPAMWHYLNQITQKGDLQYFVNWLAAIAKFEVMPTIPVVTSVQGTGKNVFIDEVLSYYLNREYVNVVNGDKIQNNFNSFLETSSLVVLDEGEFTNTKEVNNLKLLSGNTHIQVEKKGVDSVQKKRYFNMVMFSNGDVPVNHPSNDRRVSYFRLDVTLEDSVKQAGFDFIDDFIAKVREEVTEFWTILLKTELKRDWVNGNIKNNQFNKQILMMHPFGRLVIKLIEDDWEYIRLQMNEKVDDPMVIQSNLDMLRKIKETFEKTNTIDLTLVNKYINSLNFKSYLGVQQFIEINQLHRNGITKVTDEVSVKIKIDKTKVKALIHMSNNLGNLYECYNDQNIDNTLHKEIKSPDQMIAEFNHNQALEQEQMALVVHPQIDPLLGIELPPIAPDYL